MLSLNARVRQTTDGKLAPSGQRMFLSFNDTDSKYQQITDEELLRFSKRFLKFLGQHLTYPVHVWSALP